MLESLAFQGVGLLLFIDERLYYTKGDNPSIGWRLVPMKIERVLAVYKVSPLLLVVESEEGELLELSFVDLKRAGYRFSDAAWKSLVEDYRIFTCQPASR